MQDTIVIPNYFAYSFRYNVGTSAFDPSSCEFIWHKEMLEEFFHDDAKYLMNLEYGKTNAQPHVQSVLWLPLKLSVDLRNKIIQKVKVKYKLETNKGQYSLVSAKKIKSLSSYVTKDLLDFALFQTDGYLKDDSVPFTNLSVTEMARIDEWKPLKILKNDQKDLLEKQLKDLRLCFHRKPEYHEWCQLYLRTYLGIYKTPPYNRSVVLKSALKFDVITIEDYLYRTGIYTESDLQSALNINHYMFDEWHPSYDPGPSQYLMSSTNWKTLEKKYSNYKV